MTRDEAVALKVFKNHCTCGGGARNWRQNGRPERQPHMDWCPQAEEYAAWWSAIHGGEVEPATKKDAQHD